MIGRFQSSAFTKPSINKFDPDIKDMAPGLYKRLDFRMVLNA